MYQPEYVTTAQETTTTEVTIGRLWLSSFRPQATSRSARVNHPGPRRDTRGAPWASPTSKVSPRRAVVPLTTPPHKLPLLDLPGDKAKTIDRKSVV